MFELRIIYKAISIESKLINMYPVKVKADDILVKII